MAKVENMKKLETITRHAEVSEKAIEKYLVQEVNTTGEAIIIRRMAIERYFFIFMTYRF